MQHKPLTILVEGFFVDKGVDPQYNPRTMENRETYLERAERLLEVLDSSPQGMSSAQRVHLLVDLAKIETSRILADSQRLLAQTQAEANRLKRIELGLRQEPRDRVPSVTDIPPAGDF